MKYINLQHTVSCAKHRLTQAIKRWRQEDLLIEILTVVLVVITQV